MFSIHKKDAKSNARTGEFVTAHGKVKTPAFLPIGTKGSVRGITAAELKFWGADILLANTYHLWMRPGDTLIRKHGGLHKFMGWDGPILTDSGGFQVFSLGEKKRKSDEDSEHGGVLDISDKGVTFRSDIDGRTHQLTPESSMQIQSNLGSDIALVLDYFPGYPFTEDRVKRAVDLTLTWAERSLAQYQKIKEEGTNPGQAVWGIIQGGNSAEMRKKCALGLKELGFSGAAIGGVAVGEPPEVMYQAVEQSVPHLEENKPRHLLGVGTPEQIVQAVARGCDTFDCVLPTRNARHGMLYVNDKESGGCTAIRITNERYKEDFTPVDNTCDCYLCVKHTRAYLRHLFMAGELLAIRLATMHNLKFYLNFMKKIQRAIQYDSFEEMRETYRER